MSFRPLRVLALEPYYGGSHAAFLDRWVSASGHQWECWTLPAHHWKWRMRHAAITFAERARERLAEREPWELLWCSDMLSLAELRGLAPALGKLPAVAYFHENQLTYPVRNENPRDLHFGLTNVTTALAADEAWFNSEYHRNDFLSAAERLLAGMPDHNPPLSLKRLRARCRTESPGCPPISSRGPRPPGPMRIAWAARWEHDKGPTTFCRAIQRLLDADMPLELSVMGQVFRQRPPELEALETRLRSRGRLRRWGWQEPEEYRRALAECDVLVSTAEHEFFGLSVLEAISAGALPLLPRRLSYPELLDGAGEAFFYDGTPDQLAARLQQLAPRLGQAWWGEQVEAAQRAAARYEWPLRIEAMDQGLRRIVDSRSPS